MLISLGFLSPEIFSLYMLISFPEGSKCDLRLLLLVHDYFVKDIMDSC